MLTTISVVPICHHTVTEWHEFWQMTHLCNPHPYQAKEHICHPRKFPSTLSQLTAFQCLFLRFLKHLCISIETCAGHFQSDLKVLCLVCLVVFRELVWNLLWTFWRRVSLSVAGHFFLGKKFIKWTYRGLRRKPSSFFWVQSAIIPQLALNP